MCQQAARRARLLWSTGHVRSGSQMAARGTSETAGHRPTRSATRVLAPLSPMVTRRAWLAHGGHGAARAPRVAFRVGS